MDSRFRPGRRSFLAGTTAAFGAALLFPRAARASGPTILVCGSSTMGGALGRFLLEEFEQGGFACHRHAKSSSGLARPDFFDWPDQARKLQQDYKPDATVVMFGGNDGQGLYMGERSDPPWVRWQEPQWSDTYAQRVREFADAVAPGGEHVYWVGMPVVKSEKLDQRCVLMNDIYVREMQARRNGTFLETRSLFADEHGNYQDRMTISGKRVKVRASDGVHLTLAGARLLSDHVSPAVRWGMAVAGR